jgi:hypothetical protein
MNNDTRRREFIQAIGMGAAVLAAGATPASAVARQFAAQSEFPQRLLTRHG